MDRRGYGIVEPNHLSAQRTGQIYAQLPAKDDITLLENGQFVKYNYADGVVDFEGEGEWMLVFNEIKLYNGLRDNLKDFAMIKDNYTPGSDTITHQGLGPFKGQMVPRVFKTNIGDIFTTNTFDLAATSKDAVTSMGELAVGDIVAPIKTTGYLTKDSDSGVTADSAAMKWQVVKVYTMPDGQPGVKLMRIA